MEYSKTNLYAKAYVEILEIINYLGDEYRKKLPFKLLNFFEENRDNTYKYKISEIKQGPIFLKETLAILAILELKYWANEEEKLNLKRALSENEEKYQNELKKNNANN